MDYHTFLHTGIDLAPLGLEKGDAQSPYSCTPLGAQIIGWTGVDGIHYCFVPEYGETVFAVEPMAGLGKEVQPVAENFETFLRLLLDHTEAAIQQMGRWSRRQYENFQKGEWEDAELQSARQRIAGLGLAPLADAYGYVTGLQAHFDRTKLRFSREYLEELPAWEEARRAPWCVTWEGRFREENGRPGECLPVDKAFCWNGRQFVIPAVYLCSEGLVADILIKAEAEGLKAFWDKWHDESRARFDLTEEEQAQMERENPLYHDFRVEATVNGRRLRQQRGSGCLWMPDAFWEDAHDADGAWVAEHYGLDKACGWSIWRVCLPWADGRKPRVEQLSLTLKWEPRKVFGPLFTTPDCGREVTFCHPVSGVVHTLQITELEQKTLDTGSFRDQTVEYPACYTAMEYEVTPELPGNDWSLQDTAQSDPPRSRTTGKERGGSFGIFFGLRSTVAGRRAAGSALHFAPRDTVTWQITFRVEDVPPLTVTLMSC